MVMTTALVLIAHHAVWSQACPPKGKCEGNCAPWYFRNDTIPFLAGIPACRKIKGECHCVLLHSGAMCVPQQDGKNCDGPCPPVFATQNDAKNNTNPITGECITQRTGNEIYCACRYIK